MIDRMRAARLSLWLCLGLSLTATPAQAQQAPPIGVMSDLFRTCAAYVRPKLASIMGGSSGYGLTGTPALVAGQYMPGVNHPSAQEARGNLATEMAQYVMNSDFGSHDSVDELRARARHPVGKGPGHKALLFQLCVIDRHAQQIAAEGRARPGASAKATRRPAQSR